MRQLVTSSRFTPGYDAVVVRELTGKDEELVTSVDAMSAIRLVSAVTSDTSGEPIDGAHLATADRHRILAAIYQVTFGNRVESTVTCDACQERFDLAFEIPEFVASTHEDAPIRTVVSENGYDLGDGLRVRAPTGNDELSAVGRGVEDAATMMMERCVVAGELGGRISEVQTQFEALAPLLDVDLESVCPECGEAQKRRFDVQSYVLLAIQQGRPLLVNDVHLIARTYHWALGDILGLTRSHRRELAERIISERSGESA